MQVLSGEDKDFIKLIEGGTKPSPAFRDAYPNHHIVKLWHNTEPGSEDRKKAAELLKDAAQNKLRAKYMSTALTTYTDKMEQFSKHSVDTAIDLVQNARSEKVRADLAIEGMRHKVGSPTVKALVKEEKTVYLTFGSPPSSDDSHESSRHDQDDIIDI